MDEHEELRTRLEALLKRSLGSVEPELVTADGKTERHYLVRCKEGEFRARLPVVFTGSVVPNTEEGRAALAPAIRERIAGVLATRAKGDAKEEADDRVVISGTASSTSVDWYGTEMSLRALQSMAEQFRSDKGVDIVPRHGGWFTPLEWDDVMGRSIMATIDRADVAEPAEVAEPGFKLVVTSECDGALEKVKSLVRRLAKGQPIGMSIGGWFTEVRYICDEDGDIVRIIIEGVMLDHLAIVRSPANPDCVDLELMRSIAAAVLKARAKPATPEAAPTPEPAPAAAPAEPVAAARSTDAAPAPTPASAVSVEPPAPAVTPAAEEGRSDGGNPAGVTSAPVLDTTSPTRDDGHVPSARAPEAPPPSPSPEFDMTPEQLEALLQRALAPVTERLAALEAARATPAPAAAPAVAAPAPAPEAARTAPAPVPAATGDAELRARIEALEGQVRTRDAALNALASQGHRSGMGAVVTASTDPIYAANEFEGLIGRAKAEDKSPALLAVVTRAKEALTVNLRSKNPKIREICDGAPDLLRSLLNGAEMDGTLTAWKRDFAVEL
jgi:hypothetical protein